MTQQRLQELRQKKRLAELRAKQSQVAKPAPQQPTQQQSDRQLQSTEFQPEFKEPSLAGFAGEFITETIPQAFTGSDRMTPEMENLPDLGGAPELNEMSGRAFKVALGQMTTGDSEEVKRIFKEQYGDSVNFRQDEKGNDIVIFPSGEYPLNRPGLSMQDVPKLVADLGIFGKLGGAKTLAGAAGKAAGIEAGMEGVDALVGGEFDPKDVAISGALGGIAKGAELGLAKKKAADTTSQALVREADEVGVPVMTSDVIPPKTFAGKSAQQITEKIPVVGTGGVREAQQGAREKAVENIIDKYQGASYKKVIDSLKSKKEKIKSAAGSVLEKSGAKLDQVGEIPLTKTNIAIDESLEKLGKSGVLRTSTALDDLGDLATAIRSEPQTYSSLKENRTAFQSIIESFDPTVRSQMSSAEKATLTKVQAAMTTDMRKFAKENLPFNDFKKLDKANLVWANEAKKLTKTKLKNVLDKGDFTPESVNTMLFSKNKSELDNLYSSLTTEGRDNARKAIIETMAQKMSTTAAGVTPNAFLSQLKKMNPQISAFFKGRNRREVEGLQRVLEATRRAQESSVSTATGQQLLPVALGGSAVAAPLTTAAAAGSAGLMARAYESAPVRNALLRLGSVKRTNSKYNALLEKAQKAVTTAMQVERGQDRE